MYFNVIFLFSNVHRSTRILRSSTRQTFTDVSDVKAIPRTSFVGED
jgi:hypothetical protein